MKFCYERTYLTSLCLHRVVVIDCKKSKSMKIWCPLMIQNSPKHSYVLYVNTVNKSTIANTATIRNSEVKTDKNISGRILI
jgi:hypothetical protein